MTLADDFCQKLGRRAVSFRLMVEDMLSHERPLILETGCLRKIDNWEGDGQSTRIWDAVAEQATGSVWSLDISPESIREARSVCGFRTQLILGDSVNALISLNALKPKRPIDLLYLDSFDLDVNNPLPSAEHHRRELDAAWPLLRSGSLICVDDCGFEGGGKGGIVSQRLEAMHVPMIFDGYQRIWRVP